MKLTTLNHHFGNHTLRISAQVCDLNLPDGNSNSGDLSLLDVDVAWMARFTIGAHGVLLRSDGVFCELVDCWPTRLAEAEDGKQYEASDNYLKRRHQYRID